MSNSIAFNSYGKMLSSVVVGFAQLWGFFLPFSLLLLFYISFNTTVSIADKSTRRRKKIFLWCVPAHIDDATHWEVISNLNTPFIVDLHKLLGLLES